LAKLIYIGGYGRSGSTLLEYLLSAHPGVVACGEVERHLRRFGRKKVCTCGVRVRACPVWSAFQHKKGRLRGWDHERLTLSLLEHVSGEYEVMVDSSKTAWGSFFMPFRLSRKLGEDFTLVHVVRDPRGVCWSAIKTSRRGKRGLGDSHAFTVLRTTMGWIVANLACEAFALYKPGNYFRVRYEDLVHTPSQMIGDVLHRVALRLPSSIEPSEAAANRHQLYGNAMRFKRLALSELKEDVSWRTAMPKGYRWFVSAVCWPFLRKYDHRQANTKSAPSRGIHQE
jgi:hypothetical protein